MKGMIAGYALCLGLVITTALLLLTPVAHAASCSAACSGGGSISVTGYSCMCLDYHGCSYNVTQTGQTYYKACP